MAEHSEIPSAWAGLAAAGTFIGGLLAVLFGPFKMPGAQPEKGVDMGALLQRVADMERRQNETDHRMNDVFDLLTDTQKTLAACEANTREALTRLDERRRGK